MKLFPTIFSSHFFVKTNGIFINGNKTTSTSTLVKVGDILSVPKKY
jgi:ribosomal protein S4